MAKRNPFGQVRLVFRRSPLILKILVLVTILAATAALLSMGSIIRGYEQRREVLYAQAVQLQQEKAELTQRIAELGTEASIRRIAKEQLEMIEPDAKFFDTGEEAE